MKTRSLRPLEEHWVTPCKTTQVLKGYSCSADAVDATWQFKQLWFLWVRNGKKLHSALFFPLIYPDGPYDPLRAGKGNAKPGSQVSSWAQSTGTSHLCQNRSPAGTWAGGRPVSGPRGSSRSAQTEGSGGPASPAPPPRMGPLPESLVSLPIVIKVRRGIKTALGFAG